MPDFAQQITVYSELCSNNLEQAILRAIRFVAVVNGNRCRHRRNRPRTSQRVARRNEREASLLKGTPRREPVKGEDAPSWNIYECVVFEPLARSHNMLHY